MSTCISAGRLPAALGVSGALALSGLALPSVAGAATMYACVKKHTGATRIVARRSRCRRGESKLSWSTAGPIGPVGPAGAPGTPGTPGANGAVADYSATNNGAVAIVAHKEEVPVTKTVPPGSYLVSAKTIAVAEGSSEGFAQLSCGLTDNPGTSHAPETLAIDLAAWASPLVKIGIGYSAAVTLSLQSPVSTSVTSTLAVVCGSVEESAGVTIGVVYSQLSAIQISRIG